MKADNRLVIGIVAATIVIIFILGFSITGKSVSVMCTDSDYGLVYGVKGYTSGTIDGESYTYTDYCLGGTDILKEHYCEDGEPTYVKYDCSSEGKICSNGACFGTSTPDYNGADDEPETDTVLELDSIAATTKVSFWTRVKNWFGFGSSSGSGSGGSNEVDTGADSDSGENYDGPAPNPANPSDAVDYTSLNFSLAHKNVDGIAGSEAGILVRSYDEDGIVILKDAPWWYSPLWPSSLEDDVVCFHEMFIYADSAYLYVYFKVANIWEEWWLAGYFRRDFSHEQVFAYVDYKDNAPHITNIGFIGADDLSHIYVTLNDDDLSVDPSDNDDFAMYYKIDPVNFEVLRLGRFATSWRGDILYGDVPTPSRCSAIGTIDDDIQNRYGTIIYDVENNNDNEKVVFDIPEAPVS